MSRTLEEIAETLVDTAFPRQIDLELTAYCNLNCIMCPQPGLQRERGFMSDVLYRKCIDEISVESSDTEVWLAGQGDSLLVGDAVVEKVEYAKALGLSNVFLNTNGMLLTRDISRGFVAAGLDRIVFGIDAATAETHARIRVGGDLDTVVANVTQLLEEKAAAQKTRPDVWVQFIEMDENDGEREAFVEFWRKRDVGIKLRRKLINLMHVFWDGRVGRCSGDHECRHCMGDVTTGSIGGIWRGPRKKEREIHLQRRFDLLNDQCQRCIDWKVGVAEKLYAEQP